MRVLGLVGLLQISRGRHRNVLRVAASQCTVCVPLQYARCLQGDAVPSVTVFKDSPGDKVNLSEHIGKKTVVMFGVPGAFTPGCSKVRSQHVRRVCICGGHELLQHAPGWLHCLWPGTFCPHQHMRCLGIITLANNSFAGRPGWAGMH